MRRLLLVLFFVPLISFGQTQETLSSIEIAFSCLTQKNETIVYTKEDQLIDRILDAIDATDNIVLIPCKDLNNFFSIQYKGIKYILYDKLILDYMNNDMLIVATFAHELAHHRLRHMYDLTRYYNERIEPKSLEIKMQQELDADEFSGYIMAKLGIPLNEIQTLLDSFFSETQNYQDPSYSYPLKNKRLNAFNIGYNKAIGSSNTSDIYTISVEEYFNRGNSKIELEDYYGAISDYTKAIELNPYDFEIYNKRGDATFRKRDFIGAIDDFTKAIELNPGYDHAYLSRGVAKRILRDLSGACSDWNKASSLGNTSVIEWIRDECN